jgi:type II secretion system protein N
LVVTFPYDRLKERVVVEFNARQPAGAGTRLSIEDMSGYWLSGVEAEGIKLTPAPEPPGEDGKVKEPKVLTIDEAHARASILRLLVGTLQISFGAQAFGGSISGSTSDAGGGRSIEIELDGVNVGDLPLLTNAVGLPLTGALSGVIDLRLPEAKLSRSEGKIDLKVTELSVGDGKAKIRDTIALPKLDAGEMVFTAEVNDGRLKIEKFSAKGKDIEVVADGSVRLRDPIDQSLAELSLRFSFTDAYKNKSDITRGLFGAPGSSMPGLFDLDPKTKRAKRPDGFYAWRLTGPLGKLEPQPAPMGTGGGVAPSRSMRGFSPR